MSAATQPQLSMTGQPPPTDTLTSHLGCHPCKGTQMYAGNTLELKALENGIVELCFNRRHESVNKFDCLTLSELGTAIELLQTHDDLKGVLVTSAKDSFIVGADIFEFVEFLKEKHKLTKNNEPVIIDREPVYGC